MKNVEFKKFAQNIDVTHFLHYKEYLSAIYNHIKASSDSYSYLLFSEDLGFTKTNVSWLFITGRRSLTPIATKKISDAVGLKKDERKYFQHLIKYNKARVSADRENHFKKLMELKSKLLDSKESKQALEYFSEWFHPVIREMTNLKGFKAKPEWVKNRLINKLLPKQIKESLVLLEQLGLIKYNNDTGDFESSGESITPEREVEKLAAVRFHQKMIEIAKESLTRVPRERREINALTVSISPEVFEQIKPLIYKLFEEILELENACKDKEDVYQLNVQLFPFTKIDNEV